jgi:hypothetical protein
MKKNKIIIVVLFFVLLINFDFCDKTNIQVKEVEVIPIFKINELSPNFNIIPGLISSTNTFSIDKNGNLYFLDFNNNRILKFNMKGSFIKQIGTIGQGNEDLYYPQGVFVNQDIVYVLDQSGNKLKMFSLEGEFISAFKIDEEMSVKSFFVTENLVILNAFHRKKYNETKPISIFTNKLEGIKEIGKIIKTPSFLACITFNEMFITFCDNSIYGCLRSYPLIFRYDIDGKEIFYKNLRDMHIKEIITIENEGRKRGVDAPESVKENNRVRSMIYCDGFGTNGNGDIYYALNFDKAKKGIILHMDSKGELIEKTILKVNNKQARIERLFIKKNEYFALVNIDKNISLIKF